MFKVCFLCVAFTMALLFVYSMHLYVFIELLTPLTFNVIIDRIVFRAIRLLESEVVLFAPSGFCFILDFLMLVYLFYSLFPAFFWII